MRVRRRRNVRPPMVERLEPRIALAALGAASVPGRYIVVLDDSVAHPGEVDRQVAGRYGGQKRHVYEHALKGFSATLAPAEPLARAVYQSGWRPSYAPGPTRDQLVNVINAAIPAA